MSKKKSLKRNIIEWGVILGIFGILFATGLHTEVIGRIQQVILWTGIRQPDITLPEEEQKEADYDMLISHLDGETIALEQFQGKVIFMNIWASWCSPCIAEMPSIQNLHDSIEQKDKIQFVLLSVDENPEDAREFVNNRNFEMPFFMQASRIPEVFQSRTIPTTYVISPEGKIVAHKKGLAKYNTRRFREFLNSLANTAN